MGDAKFVELLFDGEKGLFIIQINIWILLLAAVVFFTIRYLLKQHKKKGPVHEEIKPVKLKYKLGGVDVDYEIVRSYQNVEIAHKIYIELITRKAAIRIEEDKDVIVEVYNSWYALFQITRDELKAIEGKLLQENESSDELVRLLTDILNKGLRPHLTQHQARFRKWYNQELENDENEQKSPQQIQVEYDEYDALIASMKEVNGTLMSYARQLELFIGKKPKPSAGE